MKSIMEEASSIIKAIEKGWAKAGEPKEFSVKIFEEPQKNFIGMTVRSAKIGIFFSDTSTSLGIGSGAAHGTGKQEQVSRPTRTAAPKIAPQEGAHKKPMRERRPAQQEVAVKPQIEKVTQKAPVAEEAASEQAVRQTPVWSAGMINDIHDWLKDSLAFISVRPLNFSKEAQHFYLKIHFDEPVFEDSAREKMLFSSLATLLLQMLKHKHRRPLKGYKIILTSKHE